MELPTQATNVLLIAVVAVLTILPLLSIPSAWRVVKIWWSDIARPRNAVMRVMAISSSVTALATVFFTLLTISFWADRLNGVPLDSDFGAVLFTLVLIALGFMPTMKWRSLAKLNGSISEISQTPEYEDSAKGQQDRVEDHRFGTERRLLEDEHIDEQAKLDNQ